MSLCKIRINHDFFSRGGLLISCKPYKRWSSGPTTQPCIDPVKTRSGHTIGETSHGYDDGRRNQSLKFKGVCKNKSLKLKLQFDAKLF